MPPGSKPKSVRVWGEIGITTEVSPFQFLKVTFGHERIAPKDDLVTIRKYEAQINDFNEAVIEKYIKKYKRLMKRLNNE